MILNKDENIENTKSDGEVNAEDEQYEEKNQQCQEHRKVIVVETKTKKKEKETQGDKTSTREEDKNKNTRKTNKTEIRHFKLHQETLVDKQNRIRFERRKTNRELTTTKKR